jgi:DnaK suppressor protein
VGYFITFILYRYFIMDDLTAAECDDLRQRLLTLQDELTMVLDVSEESARPVALDQPIGRLSRVDAIQLQQMSQANRRSYDTRLRQVRAALAAIDEDDYGYCKRCEEPVGYPRLTVRPEAPFCLSCQEEYEARQ